MALVNENFLKLPDSYLFSTITKKVNAYKITHPKSKVINLGIGDVTRPLPAVVCRAMHKAVDEMSNAETFRGYGPEQGYAFLIEAIIKHDYATRGISLEPGEVFISDGAKSDTGNIGDILRHDNSVGVTDPVYPVYIDSNVMAARAGVYEGNKWSNIVYIPCTAANHFVPELPTRRIDILYLCFPNNPTGTTLTKDELKMWVNYALANDVLILYDAAYERYIRDPDIPHSIYEIKGARKVAIEFRSFSKTAGFTGLRCGYTIVPKELKGFTLAGEKIPLNRLWNRRQSTKFNGASYITQRAAEAIYTPEGAAQIKENIDYYMTNARLLKQGLTASGLSVYGGDNAPYLWIQTPGQIKSWKFFDQLLYSLAIAGTPGVGFGPSGEGYFRFTAFGSREDTEEAVERIRK
jgi:LL-diaminopimelate aminotransferase